MAWVNPFQAQLDELASRQQYAATNALTPQISSGGYALPAKGTMRGSAKFDGSFGRNNNNPININEWGAGLWSAGYDPSDPNLNTNLNSLLTRDKAAGGEIQSKIDSGYWNNNKRSGNAATDLTNSTDWYYRDLSRRMDKSNNFLDSTLGKVISTALKIGTSIAFPVAGPIMSAGLGAYEGNRNDGGVLGTILGGVSGYGAGSLGSSIGTQGLGATVKGIGTGVSNFVQHPISTIGSTITGAASGVKNFLQNPIASTQSALFGGPASGTNALRGASLPGGRTGIMTPTGGGLVGSGQLNPAGVGIMGNTASAGINLGFSPLAVAGGAAAANIFPRFPALGQTQPLPTGGRLPGTNINVGGTPPAGGIGLGNISMLLGGGAGAAAAGGGAQGGGGNTQAVSSNSLIPMGQSIQSAGSGSGGGAPGFEFPLGGMGGASPTDGADQAGFDPSDWAGHPKRRNYNMMRLLNLP